MDDGTSPEDSLFIERATPAELSRALAGADGRVGLGVRGNGARWMGALTLTEGVTGESETFDEQRAVVGRLGLLALTATDYNVHLGASGSYVLDPADQGNGATGGPSTSRWRERPEIRVDSTRLIDTGPIPADGAYAAGVEFGANWRNLYLQAENFWYGVERRNSTLDDPEFGGYYVQGSWILTGESRRYNVVNGSYQNLRPLVPFSGNGGPGAWEIAWRYSHTDLDFEPGIAGLPPGADGIRGGAQDILSIGLNWTVNANLRFLLDYSQVEIDRLNPANGTNLPFGPAPATPPVGVEIGQDLDIYAVRTQFSF
jgi:phosphate-selective porin OprO/OprP